MFGERIRYSDLALSMNVRPDKVEESTISKNDSQTCVLPFPLVDTAYLELGPLTFAEQITQFGERQKLMFTDVDRHCIKILPLFLLSGKHVAEDIPHQVALSQQTLGKAVAVQVCPHLGSHLRLRRVLTEQLSSFAVEAWILLAHGSRRWGANVPIAALAQHLGAIAAYWSTPPSLEDCLQELVQAGFQRIAVLPYFLFEGTITDAIAHRVNALRQEFPAIHLHLAKPLEASAELTDLLIDLATQS
jgi:sirohydrochlorin ferrochelatase